MIISHPVTIDPPQTGIAASFVRQALLVTPPRDVTVSPTETFRGIRMVSQGLFDGLVDAFARLTPELDLRLAFGRQSPLQQPEPNYIHSDAMMGDVTGILYLNPQPPPGDGTIFWERTATGSKRGAWDEEVQRAAKLPELWNPWYSPRASFGRLLLFPGDYFHSRALPDNYGKVSDASARLILVCFFRHRPWVPPSTGDD